jgi:hypothetical protein
VGVQHGVTHQSRVERGHCAGVAKQHIRSPFALVS